MDGNHPKRRKDKYNPYTFTEKAGKQFLSERARRVAGIANNKGVIRSIESL